MLNLPAMRAGNARALDRQAHSSSSIRVHGSLGSDESTFAIVLLLSICSTVGDIAALVDRHRLHRPLYEATLF